MVLVLSGLHGTSFTVSAKTPTQKNIVELNWGAEVGEIGFSLVIQYCIKIGQVDQAVVFFDQAIDDLHYGNGKVPEEKRRELRKAILSNKQ